jgi:hypothetical protein
MLIMPPSTSSSTTTTTTRLNNSAVAVAMMDAFWKNSPYTAAALICGIKASLADFVAQKRQYKKRASGIPIKEISEDLFVDDNENNDDDNNDDNNNSNNSNDKIISIELDPNDSLKSYASLMKEPTKMEWQRNFAYLVYGALYQGMYGLVKQCNSKSLNSYVQKYLSRSHFNSLLLLHLRLLHILLL